MSTPRASNAANTGKGRTPAAEARRREAKDRARATTKAKAAERKKDLAKIERDEAVLAKRRLARQEAQRLAQIVNLHIAGYSLAEIGAQIGASADEVDRMLATDAARYVRSQPALRTYVRNWVSDRYTKMLDAVWDDATDKDAPKRLESQDRALRILDSMRKLHGADAPVQSEVKVEAAPEAVEKLVSALATQQGYGYDDSVFDVVDAEVVHDAASESEKAVDDAAEKADEPQEDDDDWSEPSQ